jgi:hypothetical protein
MCMYLYVRVNVYVTVRTSTLRLKCIEMQETCYLLHKVGTTTEVLHVLRAMFQSANFCDG